MKAKSKNTVESKDSKLLHFVKNNIVAINQFIITKVELDTERGVFASTNDIINAFDSIGQMTEEVFSRTFTLPMIEKDLQREFYAKYQEMVANGVISFLEKIRNLAEDLQPSMIHAGVATYFSRKNEPAKILNSTSSIKILNNNASYSVPTPKQEEEVNTEIKKPTLNQIVEEYLDIGKDEIHGVDHYVKNKIPYVLTKLVFQKDNKAYKNFVRYEKVMMVCVPSTGEYSGETIINSEKLINYRFGDDFAYQIDKDNYLTLDYQIKNNLYKTFNRQSAKYSEENEVVVKIKPFKGHFNFFEQMDEKDLDVIQGPKSSEKPKQLYIDVPSTVDSIYELKKYLLLPDVFPEPVYLNRIINTYDSHQSMYEALSDKRRKNYSEKIGSLRIKFIEDHPNLKLAFGKPQLKLYIHRLGPKYILPLFTTKYDPDMVNALFYKILTTWRSTIVTNPNLFNDQLLEIAHIVSKNDYKGPEDYESKNKSSSNKKEVVVQPFFETEEERKKREDKDKALAIEKSKQEYLKNTINTTGISSNFIIYMNNYIQDHPSIMLTEEIIIQIFLDSLRLDTLTNELSKLKMILSNLQENKRLKTIHGTLLDLVMSELYPYIESRMNSVKAKTIKNFTDVIFNKASEYTIHELELWIETISSDETAKIQFLEITRVKTDIALEMFKEATNSITGTGLQITQIPLDQSGKIIGKGAPKYSKSFADFLSEENYAVSPDVGEEFELLYQAIGGERQKLADSGLLQTRSDREYLQPLKYYAKSLDGFQFIYVPIIWLKYTQKYKNHIPAGVGLYRILDPETKIMYLAVTSAKIEMVRRMLTQKNISSILGSAIYVICANQNYLNQAGPFISSAQLISDLDKSVEERFSLMNAKLLEPSLEMLQLIRNGDDLLSIYECAMKLEAFKNKFTMDFITKIFTEPKIKKCYGFRPMEQEDLNNLVTYNQTDVDIYLKYNQNELVTQKHITISPLPPQSQDIRKVFPKAKIGELNKILLNDIVNMAQVTSEPFVTEFYSEIVETIRGNINGNYAPETSISRHALVMLESATNQYNRMNPSMDIYNKLAKFYPTIESQADLENTLIYDFALKTGNTEIDLVKDTFNNLDLLVQLSKDDTFIDEIVSFAYNEPPPIDIETDMTLNVDKFIHNEEYSHRLVSINGQSKGLVISPIKRKDAWISELMMANNYFKSRILGDIRTGSYSFSKIKNEVIGNDKLPRNFQTIIAFTQTHAQYISILAKAYLRDIRTQANSIMGFPLMGEEFNLLLKKIYNMSKGDIIMLNFSDNLYIIQRMLNGNRIFMSLDIVKGESSAYVASFEILLKTWIRLLGHSLSRDFKEYLSAFMLDQSTMKTVLPNQDYAVIANGRYMMTGTVVTGDINHQITTIIIMLTQKLNIIPIEYQNGQYVLSKEFKDLYTSLGVRFEITLQEDNFLEQDDAKVALVKEAKLYKMDMLGFDAVLFNDTYYPVLNHDRYIKQICFNKSGEREADETPFYTYMRYRSIMLGGYFYKSSELVYKHLIAWVSKLNYQNLKSSDFPNLIDSVIEMFHETERMNDVKDPFFQAVSRPYLQSMKYLLPPSFYDILSIVGPQNVVRKELMEKVAEMRKDPSSYDMMDILYTCGDRIYDQEFSDFFNQVKTSLDIVLSDQYNTIMRRIKNKIQPPEPQQSRLFKTSIAITSAVHIDIVDKVFQMVIKPNTPEFHAAMYLNDTTQNISGNFKAIRYLKIFFRFLYIFCSMLARTNSDVQIKFRNNVQAIFRKFKITQIPEFTFRREYPFVDVNFKGFIANNAGKPWAKSFMGELNSTMGNLSEEFSTFKHFIRTYKETLNDSFKSAGLTTTIPLEMYSNLMYDKKTDINFVYLFTLYIIFGLTDKGPYLSLIHSRGYKSLHALLNKTSLNCEKAKIYISQNVKREKTAYLDFELIVATALGPKLPLVCGPQFKLGNTQPSEYPKYLISGFTSALFKSIDITDSSRFEMLVSAYLTSALQLPVETSVTPDLLLNELTPNYTLVPAIYEIFQDVKVTSDLEDSSTMFMKIIVGVLVFQRGPVLMDALGMGDYLTDKQYLMNCVIAIATCSVNLYDRLMAHYIIAYGKDLLPLNFASPTSSLSGMFSKIDKPLFNPEFINALYGVLNCSFNSIDSLLNIPIFSICTSAETIVVLDSKFEMENKTTTDQIRSGYLSFIQQFVKAKSGPSINLPVKTRKKIFKDPKDFRVEREHKFTQNVKISDVDMVPSEDSYLPPFVQMEHLQMNLNNIRPKVQQRYNGIKIKESDLVDDDSLFSAIFHQINRVFPGFAPKATGIIAEIGFQTLVQVVKTDPKKFQYVCLKAIVAARDPELFKKKEEKGEEFRIDDVIQLYAAIVKGEDVIINTTFTNKLPLENESENFLYSSEYAPDLVICNNKHVITVEKMVSKPNSMIVIEQGSGYSMMTISLYKTNTNKLIYTSRVILKGELEVEEEFDRVKIYMPYNSGCYTNFYLNSRETYLNTTRTQFELDKPKLLGKTTYFTFIIANNELDELIELIQYKQDIQKFSYIDQMKLVEVMWLMTQPSITIYTPLVMVTRLDSVIP